MKVPVWIDLRRASFTLCQCGKKRGIVEVSLGSALGGFSRPFTPTKTAQRASIARANLGGGKAAIFSRSRFLVVLSVYPFDSSSNSQTSRGTCIDNVSGKLGCKDEPLWIIQAER